MKFKIDENLPIELAELLQDEGYDASTIYSESLKGAKDPSYRHRCMPIGAEGSSYARFRFCRY